MNPLRLLLLGAPGSGKGTQTSKLLNQFKHIKSVSSGDLLRQRIQQKTELGRIASEYISQGKLLPDSLMNDLVVGELSVRGWLSADSSFLLDGFPRTLEQARSLRVQLTPHNASLNLVVELDVPTTSFLSALKTDMFMFLAAGSTT